MVLSLRRCLHAILCLINFHSYLMDLGDASITLFDISQMFG